MITFLAPKMDSTNELREVYCQQILPVVFRVSEDLHFDLRKIVCLGFHKVAKLLSLCDQDGQKNKIALYRQDLLREMSEFVQDENESVRIEAFACLTQMLSYYSG